MQAAWWTVCAVVAVITVLILLWIQREKRREYVAQERLHRRAQALAEQQRELREVTRMRERVRAGWAGQGGMGAGNDKLFMHTRYCIRVRG